MLQHPAVGDVAVLGLPDLEAGELPKAFIVKKPGVEVEATDIHRFINGIYSSLWFVTPKKSIQFSWKQCRKEPMVYPNSLAAFNVLTAVQMSI